MVRWRVSVLDLDWIGRAQMLRTAEAVAPGEGLDEPCARGGNEPPGAGRAEPGRRQPRYGVVVDKVNVSVLLYAPVRSGWLAAMCCRNPTVTASLLTGPG